MDERVQKILANPQNVRFADEPLFWIMALGAILIIVGFTFKGIELYKKWHEDDDKKGDDKKEESKKENEDEKQEGETP
ncbi:hypothetical protein FACS189419_08000 [Planctomycetales bacterium]|nr:hypothetical protein FACS189419_08000 [Planctomycetales bacterium]